jgi:hypothetical protein
VCRQRLSESLRDALAEFCRGLQCKKPKATAAGQWWVRVRTGPELRFCCHGVAWHPTLDRPRGVIHAPEFQVTVAPWNRLALGEHAISRNAVRLKRLP